MGHRIYTHHLSGGQITEDGNPIHKTLCGKKYFSTYITDAPNSKYLCTKCSSRWFGKQNTQPFRLGERIVPDSGLYRSVYPILRDDELFGHVVIEHGWGKSWHIRRLDVERPNHLGVAVEGRAYTSREAALCDAVVLINDKKLWTLTQAKAAQLETQKRHEQALAKEEADRLARIALQSRIQTAFRELLDKRDLSNLQRDALYDAAKLLRLDLISSETTSGA